MIDVRNLCKNYGQLKVLKDITTTIHEGEKIAIIGPSGSGESTFLRCLNCYDDSPECVFTNPKNPRTKKFLAKVL